MAEFSHFDCDGNSRMVDVSDKEVTQRVAVASCVVKMQAETAAMIRDQSIAKGDVLEVARLAAIMGSKQTSSLIPLCHPIAIDSVEIEIQFAEPEEGFERLRIVAKVKTAGRTGVEMEALTAVSVAGLTVYDMCKSVDREIEIGPTRLEEKTGGKSGHFRREKT